jgi:hypothetical protein
VLSSTRQIKPSVLQEIRGQLVIVHGPLVSVVPPVTEVSEAKCPAGDSIVSGGYSAGLAPGAYVNQDEAVGGRSWWAGVGALGATGVSHVSAMAICIGT